jgi:hypothetical protein
MDEKKEKVIKKLSITLVVIISVMLFENLMMIEHEQISIIVAVSNWKDNVIENNFCGYDNPLCKIECR